MTAIEFISLLDARGLSPRKSGTGWTARCSGHEDKNASLSVSAGSDGRVLLKCHAGCTAEAIVGALGLKLADLFPPRPASVAPVAPRIAATYRYTSEAGELLFECVRFTPKTFRQRRPDSAKPGAWVWNLEGVRRVLYRLPELKIALAAGRTIFVCEGEKDVEALVKHGFAATCNPMGAGKWQPEHTGTLRDARRVVVIADKDEPGRKHALAVATALHGVAKCVKSIELPDRNGQPVKDAADWFAAGGTAAELRTLVNSAPEFMPKPATTTDTSAAPVNSPASDEAAHAGTDDETLAALAALPPLEFDRQAKQAAKQLGVSVTTLRSEVAKHRPKAADSLQGRTVDLAEVEAWPEPVTGADVLAQVADTFTRYVALPDGAADALALWTAHSHCFEAFQCSPRLNINSPEKGCGKTTLRDVLAALVPRPLATENLSVAVLFRIVERSKPTLLADECDAWLRDNEELRGMLNAGHRRGGQALRCEGEGNEVRAFNVFGAAVLCGIGALPGTLHDRSIVIRLERAKPGELRQRFDSRRTASEQELCRKLARWCADERAALEGCEPALPSNASNRLADNWRPLFAVATIAGGGWPQRAAAAFAMLTSNADTDSQGIGAMLLADIRRTFAEAQTGRLFSKSVVDALCAMTDRPWPEAHRGKAITETWLARRLRDFGIASRTLRIADDRAKGYEAADFSEAFQRYLPAGEESKRDSVTNQAGVDETGLSSRDTANACHASEAHETPATIDLSRCHASQAPAGEGEPVEALFL